MSAKKIILAIIAIIVLLAIPITVFLLMRSQDIRQRAAPATTLDFSPSTIATTEGEEFTVDVIVTTGGNQITGADLKVIFDPDKLEAQSIQKGTFLPNILVAGSVSPGVASITLGAPSTTPGNGTGTLATLTFKALASTSGPISLRFSQPETQVIGIGETGNVLVSASPATVTINNTDGSAAFADTSSPTATPSAAPTGAPSASPSGSVTTVITSPLPGATTTNKPTIVGTSSPLALLTITITNTTPITTTATASATGSFSFTPSLALATGSHTVTVTAQNQTTKAIETATRSFVVQGAAIGGGNESSSSSGIPVSGSTTPTLMLLLFGGLLMVFGAVTLITP